MPADPSVILLIADGIRPDTLSAALDAGTLPALARLRAEGSLQTLTTVFPSVTGPAYVPFIMGCHPAQVGLPGLRWFDRAGATSRWLGSSRSYVGMEMRSINTDMPANRPTLFEAVPGSVSALTMIDRGMNQRHILGHGPRFVIRSALTHFRGNVRGWLDIDHDIGNALARHIRTHRPKLTIAGLTGIDKTSHAEGHAAPIVLEAAQLVDKTAAQIRRDAERDGRWESMHLWVVSDHGHSPVNEHDDLATVIADEGYRVRAHPFVWTKRPDVAVMVSGNAMAHIYVALDERHRPFWPALKARWTPLANFLRSRPSVDLMLLPVSQHECLVHTRSRGYATVSWTRDTVSYHCAFGDPLGIGTIEGASAQEAYEATIGSDYPDALVQIANLASCSRSGDIILSSARGWDFRGRFEPIPHVSTHGALHRDHMLVPFLTNRPISQTAFHHPPKRTVEIAPAIARTLGVAFPLSQELYASQPS